MGSCIAMVDRINERVRKLPWHRISIEPAMFLLVLARGFAGPTDKAILYRKVCLSLYNHTVCDDLSNPNHTAALDDVQRHTSQWEFYESLCYNIPSLFTIFLYGSWSDRFSRRIPLFFCPIGTGLSTVNYLINAYYMEEAPVGLVLIGSLLTGLSGGYFTFLMAGFSYLSAITVDGDRTARISITYAFQTLGSSISTMSSGVMLDHTGYVEVYTLVLILTALVVLYIALFIKHPDEYKKRAAENNSPAVVDNNNSFSNPNYKEDQTDSCPVVQENGDNMKLQESNDTATNESDQTHSPTIISQDVVTIQTESSSSYTKLSDMSCGSRCVTVFAIDHIITSFAVTFKKRNGKLRLFIILVLAILFTYTFSGAHSVYYLYFRHYPLYWSQSMYGYYIGYHGLISFTANLLFLPMLKNRLHVSDQMLLILGLISDTAGRFWTGVCVKTWMVFITPFFTYMAAFNFSCMRSLVSNMVSPDEYGKIFAVIAWLEAMGGILSSYLYSDFLYPLTVDTYAGFSFFISAILMIIPISLAVWLYVMLKRHPISQQLYMQFTIDNENANEAPGNDVTPQPRSDVAMEQP